MNPLPARRHARSRPRTRLAGALAFRRSALAFRLHRGVPAALRGAPLPAPRRPRPMSPFTQRALRLRAAGGPR